MTHTALHLVQAYQRLLERPQPWLTGNKPTPKTVHENAPACLIFSAHPDDEVVSGALGLRLRHECAWRVVNIAVTLGSRPDRRQTRWQEAQAACDFLGFELCSPAGMTEKALEGVHLTQAEANTSLWQENVQHIVCLLENFRPQVLVCPHHLDGHATHMATARLVQQALAKYLGKDSRRVINLLSSEYWSTQANPSLAVGLSAGFVATLMDALVQHAGEVARHPYHLLLPAWFIDSARRAAECLGTPGGQALPFPFASLYGWQRWQGNQRIDHAPLIWRPDMQSCPEDMWCL